MPTARTRTRTQPSAGPAAKDKDASGTLKQLPDWAGIRGKANTDVVQSARARRAAGNIVAFSAPTSLYTMDHLLKRPRLAWELPRLHPQIIHAVEHCGQAGGHRSSADPFQEPGQCKVKAIPPAEPASCSLVPLPQ